MNPEYKKNRIMEDKNINKELVEELELRCRKISRELERSGIDAALISSNANIYYSSGRMFRGYAYITSTGDVRYLVIRPGGLSDPKTIYIRKPEQILSVLKESGVAMPANIGLELDTLPYTTAIRLKKAFDGISTDNISNLLNKVREIKTPYEIARMKEDGDHQVAVYRHISRLYKEDMTDIEFQIEIERILRLEGCLGFTRMSGNLMEINMGSVLAGNNADAPGPYDFSMGGSGVDLSLPVGADGSVIREGTTVMVDMNGNFNGYQTDMTRVWKLGEISSLAEHAHEVSRLILRELEKKCVPGFPISEAAQIAYDIVKRESLDDYFMGHEQKAGFIGHGVGIVLNETPVIMLKNHDPFMEHQTIALEPKFVIPGVGAVGVENTYVVTAGGLENITVYDENIQDLR